jgi:hypothetical protein
VFTICSFRGVPWWTCPWMNSEISRFMGIRDKYYESKTRYPNNAYVVNRFKYFRNRVTSLIRRSKGQRLRLPAQDWCVVLGMAINYGRFLGKWFFTNLAEVMWILSFTGSDGGLHTNSRTVCDAFNDYFVNVAAQICQPSSLSANPIDANYSSILSRPCLLLKWPVL